MAREPLIGSTDDHPGRKKVPGGRISLYPDAISGYKELNGGKTPCPATEILMTGSAKVPILREVMDIRQASEYLGISADSLYRYASEGFVPAFKLGNRWRFKKTLLDSWMDEKSGMKPVAGKVTMMPREKKPAGRTRQG